MFAVQPSSVKDLALQFAHFFSKKDSNGIESLLTDDFVLYDPVLKSVQGKKNVANVFKKQFNEIKKVSYEVLNAYEEGDTGILEFKITLDDQILYGVDFIRSESGKMIELRCYYNPVFNDELKPLSTQAKSFMGGEIYEHYKGKRYKILAAGRNSENLEESIVYQALYGDFDVWIRPLKMFLENIVVNGQTQPRFRRVSQ